MYTRSCQLCNLCNVIPITKVFNNPQNCCDFVGGGVLRIRPLPSVALRFIASPTHRRKGLVILAELDSSNYMQCGHQFTVQSIYYLFHSRQAQFKSTTPRSLLQAHSNNCLLLSYPNSNFGHKNRILCQSSQTCVLAMQYIQCRRREWSGSQDRGRGDIKLNSCVLVHVHHNNIQNHTVKRVLVVYTFLVMHVHCID